MSSESRVMGAGDGRDAQSQKDQPWLKMSDEGIYILNPFYRLRNSKFNYVLVHGIQGLPQERISRAAGVVLALCNGKRTVADIARITRPLVKIAGDAAAVETAKEYVKAIIHAERQTPKERNGKPRGRSEFTAQTVLLAKADYDRIFGRTKFARVEYKASDFLPRTPSEITSLSNHSWHEGAPASLLWHPTSACSTDCRYCYLRRRKIKPMPKERVLSLIEEAAAIGVMEIDITGGDILLYPYLEDILAAMCKHKFPPTELSTKSFLGKEQAKIIAEAASVVLAVQFSIDSTVSDVADYLVRTKNYCSRVFKSIDNALEAGLCVNAKAVITPYNILTIPKLYRDLKKRGVSTIRPAIYCRSGFRHSDDFFNHPTSFQWLEEQVKQLQQEFPNDFIQILNDDPCLEPPSLEARQRAWSKGSRCIAGRTRMMICADGKVIPCEEMPEIEEYFCGDVSHQSIQEVWDGDRLRELTYGIPREKFKGQPCYNCEEREVCVNQKGNCIRDLAAYEGNIYQPPLNCPKHDRNYIRVT